MKKYPSQEEIDELHRLILVFAIANGWSRSAVLAFLKISFVGTMAMANYSDEFFDKTCERMKEKFKNHPMRNSQKREKND